MHNTLISSKLYADDENGEKEKIDLNDSVTILIAEDNFLNQKVIAMLLDRLGLKTMVVSNGIEALVAFSKHEFSAILMDCRMPSMDGLEASSRIRKLERRDLTYTPIIAITALAMEGDLERCLAAGMDDYISKPIDRIMLKTKLDYWIRKHAAFKEQKLSGNFSSVKSGAATQDVDLLNIAQGQENP